MPKEDRGGTCRGSADYSQLANSTAVPKVITPANQSPKTVATKRKPYPEPREQRTCPPALVQTAPDCMQIVRTSIQKQGVSDEAANIILKSWQMGMSKQYDVYIRKWTL